MRRQFTALFFAGLLAMAFGVVAYCPEDTVSIAVTDTSSMVESPQVRFLASWEENFTTSTYTAPTLLTTAPSSNSVHVPSQCGILPVVKTCIVRSYMSLRPKGLESKSPISFFIIALHRIRI